ncbi:MAG: hypothetical protein ACE5ET_03825 [Gammaproteobacteria bacterium]
MKNTRHPPRPQRGAVTLTVCLLLLFILSLMSLYAARLGITELQLSNNEYRHGQAQSAAAAGLNRALAALRPEHLGNDGAALKGPAGSLPDGSRYASSLHPLGDRLVELIATGRAADGSSSQQLRQLAVFLPYLSRPPPATIIAHDAIHLGEGSVLHDSNGIRVWSGGPLYLAGLPVASKGMTCTDAALCPDDNHLTTLPPSAWLAQFFTLPLDQLRKAATSLPPGVDNSNGGLLLIDNAGAAPVTLRHTRIGSAKAPAILVITGDVAGISDSRIHGLLYIAGNFSGDVSGLILEGALICAGHIDIGSGFYLHHEAVLMKRLLQLGRFAKLPGSWRDFGFGP